MIRPIYLFGPGAEVLSRPARTLTWDRYERDAADVFAPQILASLLADLRETLYACAVARGVGLAAPQIGVDLRVSVIDLAAIRAAGHRVPKDVPALLELINPVIVEREGKNREREGCLSFPQLSAFVSRPARVRVQYLDRDGQPRELVGEQILARALAHEVSHLEGRLIVHECGAFGRDVLLRQQRKLRAAIGGPAWLPGEAVQAPAAEPTP